MPESPPVAFTANAGTSETVLATTAPVPGSQGPTNVNNPQVPTIPQVLVRVFYNFSWGATSAVLTLRCRRGVGAGGTEITLPVARPQKTGPGAANSDFLMAEWTDTNVPLGTVYTITGQVGTAAVTGGSGYVSTNDCT